MTLLGIHHLTAVCSDAQRTVDFYTKILGLRLMKKTVNFDDPSVYHLYFGDETGKPGTLVTFFEWSHLPKGHIGIGATHHLALIVESYEVQLKWKRWLIDQGIGVTGPYDRKYFSSIYFEDPDGLILEIATRLPGWTVDEPADKLGMQSITPPFELTRFGRDEDAIARIMWAELVEAITPDMQLKGLHHITAIASDIDRTTDFYTHVLGMKLLKRTLNYDDLTAPHYYFGVGDGKPGTIITYFGYPFDKMRIGEVGTGMTHHFAFAVADDEIQREWRIKLMKADVQVTPVIDRIYFKSIYFQDPDRHILEIATIPPGFLIDEERNNLGTNLKLPPWLESNRQAIEETLTPLTL
ncbi:MAG: VOC family protein [Ignavibacteriae bacterium]|nr:VOC family protein [Ignavibacteria bacterium]MBI3364196.1 VOC family protein [Ignavibacteriota bacterium]